MHEYSLMENVIENIIGQLKADPLPSQERLEAIHLKVGALDIHSIESFKQAFLSLAKGTALEACELELEIMPGHLECGECDFHGECPVEAGDGHDAIPVAECPQCGHILPIQGGRGIQEIELTTAIRS